MQKKMRDGTEIDIITWQKSELPRAHILIIHGMAEHIKRYDDFANFLAEEGYYVYGYDQRGHGQTAGSVDHLGYFDLGWSGVVGDVKEVIDTIPRTAPLILMGHSMGSFIVRDYIRNFSETIDGLILSGTSASNGIRGRLTGILANIHSKFKGKKALNKTVADLMEKECLKALQPPRTPFDWLSRDASIVDKYISDPYCGTIFSNKFYKEIFPAIERVNQIKNFRGMDLPVYIFSGEEDPIGNYGKGVKKVYELFSKLTEPVEMRLYTGGRHEMLNELNNKDVYNDILNWLNKRCYA